MQPTWAPTTTPSSTPGGFNVTEAYGELNLPLISNMPFVQDLELSLAMRAFKYSTFGSDSTYKVGARYAPVRDLVLRGTYSTAFRAPNIGELFASGLSDSYDFVPTGDPCANGDSVAGNCGTAASNGDTALQFLTKKGANPNLKPETAKIFTLGAIIEPRWVPNLSLTFDYYVIDLTKTVTYQGAGVILQGCYASGIASDCARIHRDADNLIIRIDDALSNAGGSKTAGLDMAARYNLQTGVAGQFTFVVDGTLLQYYRLTQADGTVISGKSNYDLGILPAFKGNAGVIWGMEGFGAGLSGRYIGSFKECESLVCSSDPVGARQVKSYLTADAYVSYNFKSSAGKTGLSVGMQNLLDTQPPPIYTAANYSADPSAYGYAGRFYYARVTQSF